MPPPHKPTAAKKHAFGWNCRTCSFQHHAPANRCTMCGELRGASRQEMHDFVLGKPVAPRLVGNCVELLDSSPEAPAIKKPMATKPNTTKPVATATANTNTKSTTSIRHKNAQDNNYSNQQRHNHRPPPSLPKQSSTITQHKPIAHNPYFKRGGLSGNNAHRSSNNNNTRSSSSSSTNQNQNTRGGIRNPYALGKPPQEKQQQQSNLFQKQPENHNEKSTAIDPQHSHGGSEPPKGPSHVAQGKENPLAVATAPTASVTTSQPAPPKKHHPFFDKATRAPSQSKSRKKQQPQTLVHRFGFAPGPVPHDPETALTYIYPKHPDYPTREYQLEITETALNYNTLVSLPTGLGKTHIAAVVMYNFYRWFSSSGGDGGGKIIFLAPTLPLVHQQIEACYKITGIPGEETAVMTGKLKAAERKELWKSKRVFYCTPQTVQRDILGACPGGNAEANNHHPTETTELETDTETAQAFSRVVCLVLDEAHKATGDYAYTRVVDLLERAAGAKFRIVGLSATPGTSIKAIQGVIEALRSCKIEARTDSDPSVAPYLHQKRTEIVICPRNTSQREISRKISGILQPVLERLRQEGGLQAYGNDTMTSYAVLKGRQKYQAFCQSSNRQANGGLISCFHAAYTLVQLRHDLNNQGLGVVKTKVVRMKNERHKGILSTIVKSEEFADVVQTVLDATNGSGSCENVVDPKLSKLCELLKHHFERNNACNHSSRAIVFAQFRDSVKEIVNCLESNLKPLVRSRYFVGQNKGSSSSSAAASNANVHGMKQAEQQRAIKDFRNNVFNVLVCTSIGEEGLDIGDVDLIINYDVISSPIRTIQRAGRTGRKRDGRVVSLIAEGHEERTHKKRLAGEKTLLNALKNPKKFVMASHHPMLPHAPEKEYKVLEFKEKLSLSEVAGAQHTPGVSKAEKKKREWRLDATEEYERQTLCGSETVVSLKDDVTWERLKGFFCKNRVDPTKLPGSRKANRRILSLGKDHVDKLLWKRNKIRRKRQGNRRKGRIEEILASVQEHGPIYSEGTTRSGYRDILSIFPVDPVEEKPKSDPTRVNKKLWGETNKDSEHLEPIKPSTSTAMESESRPAAPAPITESEENPTGALNPSRSGKANTGSATMPERHSQPNERPAINSTENKIDASGKDEMAAVEPLGWTQTRELPVSNSASAIVPQQSSFRLPTPPPSSDDDSSVGATAEEKVDFRLPTPPPSSPGSSASPAEEEQAIFRLPTPPPSSDSSSEEGDDIVDSDTEAEPRPWAMARLEVTKENATKESAQRPESLQTRQQHDDLEAKAPPQDPIESNEKVIFRLPTPPPSSSSSSSEGGVNDDSDTITVPEPNPIGRMDYAMDDPDDNGAVPPVVDTYSNLTVKNLQKGELETKVIVGNISIPASNAPKISVGFDDENDVALSSLKTKSDRMNCGDDESESEEDVPLISFSNKKKPNSSKKRLDDDFALITLRKKKSKKSSSSPDGSNADKQILPRVSFGKSPSTKTLSNKTNSGETSCGDESEEDIPLASFSSKEKAKSTSSQKPRNSIPHIDKNFNPLQDNDSAGKQVLAPSSSVNGHRSQMKSKMGEKGEMKELEGSLKRGENSMKRLQILETPGSASVHFNIDSTSTQNTSENEIIDSSKCGNNRTKHRRIADTPETTGSDLHRDLTSASMQEPSENEILDHSKKISSKRLRIGSEDSDESIGVEDTQQPCSNLTQPNKFDYSASSVLQDTPQMAVRSESCGVGKQSASDMLTDTPNTSAFKSVGENIVCEICASGDSTGSDPLILCDACNLGFHKDCYPIRVDAESDGAWYCDSCLDRSRKGNQETHAAAIACTYCCRRDGALRTDGKTWHHPLCAAFASRITAVSCGACSLVGAVQCSHNGCSDAIHPYCGLDADWTIVRSLASSGQLSEYSIFCPTHKDDACQSPSAQIRTIQLKSSSLKRNRSDDAMARPKKLQKKNAKLSKNALKPTGRNSKAIDVGETIHIDDTDEEEESPQTKKHRLRERRRQGLAKFVLDEAEIGSDQEQDDAEEEEELRRIEEEEEGFSQDSFINDDAILSQHFSQDNLREIDPDASSVGDDGRPKETPGISRNSHRALDALRERENRFKTPNFNRRMMRPSQGSSSTPSSSQGLGNMNFIRSVLEHHRRGGDCDQIEAEYKRLESSTLAATNNALDSAETTTAPNSNGNNGCIDLTTSPEDNGISPAPRESSSGNNSNNQSNGRIPPNSSQIERQPNMNQAQPPSQPPRGSGLTAEQLARIEANRQAALRRRAEVMAKKWQGYHRDRHHRDPTR